MCLGVLARGAAVGKERVLQGLQQIGEVAERTGLSLRTIRYYEEVGLVVPAGRSSGGFRLYSDDDVQRLLLVKHTKPLNFSLEEMRDLLAVLDVLTGQPVAENRERAAGDRAELRERLAMFREAARTRVESLRSEWPPRRRSRRGWARCWTRRSRSPAGSGELSRGRCRVGGRCWGRAGRGGPATHVRGDQPSGCR